MSKIFKQIQPKLESLLEDIQSEVTSLLKNKKTFLIVLIAVGFLIYKFYKRHSDCDYED